MPALFTRISMRPSSRRVRSTIAARSLWRVTSVGSVSAVRPRPRTSLAVRSAPSASSSATTTSAPRRASSSAVARPMPRPPPVPVPKPYLLCEDDSVIGTIFYVMDCVHGRIFRDANLPGATPAERRAIYESMNDVLARLHLVDWKAIGLADFGRPGDYYARQIHRWSQQYRASETEKIEAMERLMEWLPKNIPASTETTLVHGDYRPGNMIVHPSERRVAAVLDWELSTLGHPMADLAYNCMPYHLGNEWEGLRDAPL